MERHTGREPKSFQGLTAQTGAVLLVFPRTRTDLIDVMSAFNGAVSLNPGKIFGI